MIFLWLIFSYFLFFCGIMSQSRWKIMSSLESIHGIGEKTKELLVKLDIYTVEDLISYYPKRYQVIKRTDMGHIQNGDKVIIDGVVEGQPTVIQIHSKLRKVIFRIATKQNIYNVSVFNQVYLSFELKYGMKVIVIGKFDKFKNTIIASEIRNGELSSRVRIEPIYALKEGISYKFLSKVIDSALVSDISLVDYIPIYLKERYHFLDKLSSIFNIHHPKDVISYRKSLQRLKYEELFLYLLKIHYLKLSICNDSKAIEREFDDTFVKKFISELPFSLTMDQLKAIDVIKSDLKSKKRMNRLVQGDVGSGKTIVAFIASYMNYLSGYQTALMVPTEILARQHYQNASSLFSNTKMRIGLLSSSISVRERNLLLKKIKDGEIDFLIGTQSLIQEGVVYSNLGLIITDEQHRFGVNQRNELKNKGVFPDILSMSATPIPRTYALTIYGDMDVSSIHTKPVGRKEVITYFKKEKDLLEVLQLMKRELELHHQVYVIAPAIMGKNMDELDNVQLLKEKMELAFGKVYRIGVVHGKMGSDAKSFVMSDFENGDIDILISTTVIEVGVNVPNASMIVIFNANRYGLSTLHQLRGRVGRGDIQSYCILIAKDASERLAMLEKTSDGFLISEYDFKMRGEGDLFGIRQSGEIGLKLANIKKDFDLLVRVKEDVDEFFKQYFMKEEYHYLLDYLKNYDHLEG